MSSVVQLFTQSKRNHFKHHQLENYVYAAIGVSHQAAAAAAAAAAAVVAADATFTNTFFTIF